MHEVVASALQNSLSGFHRFSSKRKQASFCFRHLQQLTRARKGGEIPMSAFIVADKTINNVVNWLEREIFHLSIITHKLNELGLNTGVAGWAEDLGQAMFQLNIKAVDARYGDGQAEMFRKLDYRHQITEPVPLMQVLKSLQCWLYQCDEGNVPETELYGLFDTDVQLYLMDKIITALPEYEQAKWG
jgi:hypothetical protein